MVMPLLQLRQDVAILFNYYVLMLLRCAVAPLRETFFLRVSQYGAVYQGEDFLPHAKAQRRNVKSKSLSGRFARNQSPLRATYIHIPVFWILPIPAGCY